MLSCGRVGSRRPQECLVERPGADHDDSHVRALSRRDRRRDFRRIVGPQFAAFCVVDLGGSVRQKLGKTGQRTDTVQARVEENVIAELP